MKIGKVVKYCVLGFIGVCVIYNPELLPGALCYASLYGVVRYTVMKKRKSKEIQAQRSKQNTKAPGQPVQRLQESEIAKMRSCAEFAQHEMDRQAQESEAKTTSGVAVKPSEPPVQDAEKGIEWARRKLCKEVTVYDAPQDSIFSSDLDVDLIASMIETKQVNGADGIAYARSLLASDVDECIDDQEPVKHEDGISYARSLLSRGSGVVKEELKPVREPEKPESIGGVFSVTERDIETCRAVAAFLRAYYASRYNLV